MKYNISLDTNYLYKIYRQRHEIRKPRLRIDEILFRFRFLLFEERTPHFLDTDLITPRLGDVSDPSVGVVSGLVVNTKETHVNPA